MNTIQLFRITELPFQKQAINVAVLSVLLAADFGREK
jgi:hypothetical protein